MRIYLSIQRERERKTEGKEEITKDRMRAIEREKERETCSERYIEREQSEGR